MASSCHRFISRSSLSSIKSAIRSNAPKSPITRSPTSPSLSASPRLPSSSLPRRFSFSSRMRAVVAAATQCRGGGEDDFMLEYDIEELPSALTGYTLLHLSRPLIAFITMF
ncbi:hypothetical protein JCGZ_03409 [Jatropha curcas]|uniref:Uncharacterized protein n=1 Tax=Jatropha curcas TaxID=180498 RepID=A0A067KY24_JATCU|nr:hypothetical protein JCGZ_03409 [Jatropha curcas]